jgi:hypothetical protein
MLASRGKIIAERVRVIGIFSASTPGSFEALELTLEPQRLGVEGSYVGFWLSSLPLSVVPPQLLFEL